MRLLRKFGLAKISRYTVTVYARTPVYVPALSQITRVSVNPSFLDLSPNFLLLLLLFLLLIHLPLLLFFLLPLLLFTFLLFLSLFLFIFSLLLYMFVYSSLPLPLSHRKLAQSSSVDQQGKDTDASFAHRADPSDEVRLYQQCL